MSTLKPYHGLVGLNEVLFKVPETSGHIVVISSLYWLSFSGFLGCVGKGMAAGAATATRVFSAPAFQRVIPLIQYLTSCGASKCKTFISF